MEQFKDLVVWIFGLAVAAWFLGFMIIMGSTAASLFTVFFLKCIISG